jgi:isoleucyl-tRNA synthetase
VKTKKPLLDKRVFDHVVELFRKHGSDVWYDKDAKDLLPPGVAGEFRKEEDILDVWFDSGVSWVSVLKAREETKTVARGDVMYLEGSDQHRGWFQTSLIPAVALTGAPPYGQVLTHGFILDGQGRAMSKSAGNGIAPQDLLGKLGADIIRLWVAVTDYREDVRLSPQILERVVDTYRKLRNTLRFLLGNLGDFTPDKAVPLEKMEPLDLAVLGALNKTIEDVTKSYDRFEFHLVTSRLADQFCINVLSEYYLDVQKDILYCDRADSPRRRSAQTAFLLIAKALAKMLAPLLSFTAEETWQSLKEQNLLGKGDDDRSVFLNAFPDAVKLPAGAPDMDDLLRVRRAINEAVEKVRQSGEVKGLNDTRVILSLPKALAALGDRWTVFSGAAQAVLQGEGEMPSVSSATKAPGAKCPRCWVTRDLTPEGLCPRCADAEAAAPPLSTK